ncbi:hypothetical protein KA977_15280 [Candidatus Dependentiae bacterium]|nr:hypothetical protein [Candidatus Dependentiae bacterium]
MPQLNLLIIRYGALGDTLTLVPLLYLIRKTFPEFNITVSINVMYSEFISKYCSFIKEFDLKFLNKPDLSKYDFIFPVVSSMNSTLSIHLKSLNLTNMNFADMEYCEKSGFHVYKYLINTFSNYYKINENIVMPSDFFSEYNSEIKLKKMLFHPGSGSKTKNLSKQEIENTIKKYCLSYENTDVLMGPAELKDIELQNIFFDYNCIKNVSGMEKLIKIIKQYYNYIGLDSGISHLAGLCGLKCSIIFKKSNFMVWSPFGKNISIDFLGD